MNSPLDCGLRFVRRVRLRVRALLVRGRVEQELDDEFAFHLAMQQRASALRGMPEHEAERHADSAQGQSVAVRDRGRGAGGGREHGGVLARLRRRFPPAAVGGAGQAASDLEDRSTRGVPFLELAYPELGDLQRGVPAFESVALMPTTLYGYGKVPRTGHHEAVQIESAPASH